LLNALVSWSIISLLIPLIIASACGIFSFVMVGHSFLL